MTELLEPVCFDAKDSSFLLFSRRILVCPQGLVEIKRWKVYPCAWDDIVLVEETRQERENSYCIHRRSGEVKEFDRSTINGLDRLMMLIRAETERRNIPWKES
jgi:hypothetical protein